MTSTEVQQPAPRAYVRALKLSDLPAGSKKAVKLEGQCVLLCHLNDRLFAVSNVCSHAEKPLERGRMGNGWIACPVHGARFELSTGKALNLPAVKPIATFELRVVEEWIEVLI